VPEDTGQDPTDQEQDSTRDDQQGGQVPTKEDSELARARAEAAKHRTELRDTKKHLQELEEKLKERDDAEKSELQKATEKSTVLEAEINKAQEKVHRLTVQNAVVVKAIKLDIVDPDAAFRLLDLDAVEFDGDTPTNIEDLLTKLVEDKPYLLAKGPAVRAPKVNPTQPATHGGGKKDGPLKREDIDRMTDDEIAANLDEVMEVMAKSGVDGKT
jgi:hypothetical protein